jgi:hypothetical protein
MRLLFTPAVLEHDTGAHHPEHAGRLTAFTEVEAVEWSAEIEEELYRCLLYTSDAADEA